MSFARNTLSTLTRPKLLVRAARHGAGSYNRARDLPKLIQRTPSPSASKNLATLVELEREMEEKRALKDPSYKVSKHIAMLAALMSEHGRAQEHYT